VASFIYIGAIKSKLSFVAHVGKQAWRVITKEVNVAEHDCEAIRCHAINSI
jgi:hypothetical protein